MCYNKDVWCYIKTDMYFLIYMFTTENIFYNRYMCYSKEEKYFNGLYKMCFSAKYIKARKLNVLNEM